ncbi:hypothetical protein, conserved [Eimeria necatrix]|uniref:Uncharacterized protein n=1 Tax=Eimeria necatrix TaxID=51315 RepID=U6MT13_9EIME|nr:hypothetical protein, conserved [Eimeria necatrix]CDJ65579.1 hypothetical protein, conserved [Eimeria necatrix]
MTHLLMEALTEPLDIIDNTYVPLLWSADRLGRSVSIEGAPKTIPASMRQLGFRTISMCYRAGVTYKWLRGCRYPSEFPKEGHSPFSVLKRCLASKVYSSNKGAGYLDRVAVRLPTASTAVLDRIIEVGSAGESLPAVFASIRKGVHVYDLRSDHSMVGSVIEFLKLD